MSRYAPAMKLRTGLLAAAALAACLGAPAAGAAERTLTLDPKTARLGFTLGATLHSAEGTIALASGQIRFDEATGAASGEVVIDAKSAETGNGMRDANMHRDVLASEQYPRIVFHPERIAVLRRDASSADVELTGSLEMHGVKRPLAVPAHLALAPERVGIEGKLRVDYVDWGVPDYSTFILRVDRFVDVTLKAEGRLSPL